MAGQEIQQPKAAPNVSRPTDTDLDQLTAMCKSFLKVQIPSNNIISASRFNKYFPLFNNEAIKRLSESEQKRLYEEYHREFSLQHPIKIYGRTVDDPEGSDVEVIYVESDKAYHEVLHTIPPMFRQLKTLNELGSRNAAGLINSFLNTAIKSDNPIAQAEFEKYGYAIGKCIEGLNPPDEQANREFEQAEKALVKGGEEEASKKSQSNDDAMTDLFDDW